MSCNITSYFMWSVVLDSSYLLLPCSMISIASHITIILISDIYPLLNIHIFTLQSWIELSAMRKNKAFTGHSMESKTQTVQNCIRRYLASKKVTSRETVEKEHRILFTKFCSRTMKGITLKMFSRKHGTVVERLLAFDSDCKSIVYPTNSYGSFGEIPIKDIYHVQRGMSGELYPLATVGAKNNTFHLALLGGRYIDLEALSTADAKLFFFGFSRLRTLANSR